MLHIWCLDLQCLDYKVNKSGTKHPFVPSSRSPSRVFYTHTAFSVDAGMIEVKPTIVWLPRLSPQMVGSAPSDHYLGSRVARPLNSLLHAPLAYRRWTVRGSQADRLQNICHCLGANASFANVRFWMSDVPSRRFTSVCPYLYPIYGQVDVPVTNYGHVDVPVTNHGHLFSRLNQQRFK